jgi:hypothetical protein
MKGRILNIVLVLVLVTLPMVANAGWSEAQQVADQTLPAPSQVERTLTPDVDFKSSPVMFIENAGQWDDGARFQVWGGPAGTMWLAEDAIWITVVEPEETSRQVDKALDPLGGWPYEDQEDLASRRGVNIKLTFVGANPQPRIEAFDRLDTTISYFYGNDPEQWWPDVPVWGGLRYVDLYPGVDLVMGMERGIAQQDLWRLEASPGAAWQAVRLRVEGVVTQIAADRVARLATGLQDVSLPLPTAAFSYPLEAIDQAGALSQHLVHRSNARDASRTDASEFIPQDDPTHLLFGTFLGGSANDLAWAMAVDGSGRAYVGGETVSNDFPTTPGAFDPARNSTDNFIARLNPAGSALDYATFLGGSRDEAYGFGIAVDSSGRAYVAGRTDSIDFPTTAQAFDRTFNGAIDAYVARLSATGSALEYSTYLGGTTTDVAYSIAVDPSQRAYVVGSTFSVNFPTTVGVVGGSYSGGTDGFAVRLSSTGSDLEYATFLGGTNLDRCAAVAVDLMGRLHVAGFTASSDFPTTPGAFDTSYNGGYWDTFALRLNSTGSALDFSTFVGGDNEDTPYAVAVDAADRTYVAGSTKSLDFPTSGAAVDPTHNGSDDAFVFRLNSTGSALEFSTFLGGSRSDGARSVATDASSRAYVTGSADLGFPVTAGAFDTSYNNAGDVFVTRLSPDGSALEYSTYLGGAGYEIASSCVAHGTNEVFVAGLTGSVDFPTSLGAFDRTHNGLADAFVSRLAMGNQATATATPTMTPAASPTPTSTPFPTPTPTATPGNQAPSVYLPIMLRNGA